MLESLRHFAMRRVFDFLGAGLLILVTVGQVRAIDLYSNQSADPSVPALNPLALSKSGVSAPAGTFWSELQNDVGNMTESNTNAGYTVVQNAAQTSNFRAADDFTVPSTGWRLTEASFYGYRTGNDTTTTPFLNAYVQIWDGRPGDIGSNVIFGDLTTNRLTSSAFSGMYRVFNTQVPPPGSEPGTTRALFENRVSLIDGGNPFELSAGTYWIEWTYQLTVDTFTSFSPTTTHEGMRGVLGANGRQFTQTTWVDLIDNGNPSSAPNVAQDWPFILRGTVVPEPSTYVTLVAAVSSLMALRRRTFGFRHSVTNSFREH